MRKQGFLFFAILLVFSLNLVSAINLEVSGEPIQSSAVVDINEPAVFQLTIRNLGEADIFDIYSLVGVDISPKNLTLESGEKNVIIINVMPQQSLASKKGSITIEYKIKGSNNEIQAEELTMNIIDFKDALTIEPENINPRSKEIKIMFKNNLNHKFDDLKVNIDSTFFNYEDVFSLEPMEEKDILIPLDTEKLKKITAGSYLMDIVIETKNVKTDIESLIRFVEQEGIQVTEEKSGLLIRRTDLTKENVGNTVKDVEITTQKNVISYLFTTFNIIPTEINRHGLTIDYIWRKELIPGDKLEVITKTNWFYPLIIVIFAVVLFILIKRSVETDLILRKQVSYVRTKGGEFALKVSIRAKAKKFIERINIIDKIPPLVELYEKYGAISPDKVDMKNRRIEWDIESLNEKEERIFSYIIYSKIGVVGRFELPKARVVYEKSGKIKESESNRSFFINEPKMKKA